MSKKQLSLAEHKRLGRTLKNIREALLTACTRLANAYALDSEPVRLAQNALATVDSLRSKLDDHVYADFAGIEGLKFVYYPGPGRPGYERWKAKCLRCKHARNQHTWTHSGADTHCAGNCGCPAFVQRKRPGPKLKPRT